MYKLSLILISVLASISSAASNDNDHAPIPLTLLAAIGFIALFGQAVLNGVVMLSHFGRLRERGENLYDAAYNGSLDRLRTVIMTALLAMLGLLPMALSHAIRSETQRPLAIVVIGGLVSATLLTLLMVPTLYLWAHRRDEHPALRSGDVARFSSDAGKS